MSRQLLATELKMVPEKKKKNMKKQNTNVHDSSVVSD